MCDCPQLKSSHKRRREDWEWAIMIVEPGVVADGPVCHGLCGAQPAPSRLAAKRYVGRETKIERVHD
jgi:hypothetical protein